MNDQPPKRSSAAKQLPAKRVGEKAASRRQLQKLFEPKAEPLDAHASTLVPVRPPRRARPWIVLLCLALPLCTGLADDNSPTNAILAAGETNVVEVPDDDEISQTVTNMDEAVTNESDFAYTNGIWVPTVGSGNTDVAEQNSSLPVTQAAPAAQPAVAASRGAPQNNAVAPPSGAHQKTNTAGSSGSAGSEEQRIAPPTADYNAFRIIAERNIFDPNRGPRRVATTNSRPQRPRSIDSLALVGVLSYEKGTFAFFDGNKSEFKKAAKESDKIAGFTIAKVDPNGVRLSSGEKTFELSVGMQLKREDDGAWQRSQAESFADSPRSTSSSSSNNPPNQTQTAPSQPSSAPNAGNDEVLRRLMERRERE